MVAAEAGVSVSTVSKVLNGRVDVSAETKERVATVMAALGYRRRPARRPGTAVELVLNEIDSLWSVEIIRGVEETLRAAGATLVLSAVHGRDADTRQWLDGLADRRSGGAILVVAGLTPHQGRRLTALDVPLVLIDPVGDTDPRVPAVGATNWAGAVGATRHLVDLGHRRIAHLAGPPGPQCSRARADGYRAVLEREGLPVPEGHLTHGDFTDASGRRETARLLDTLDAAGQPPPTALFAASDLQALGAIEVLRARGHRVPEDVSVVGFDDLPVARWSHPQLTTVRQPLHAMAATAARTLLDLLDGEPAGARRVELATDLIVRASTAPPAG
ncbi:LacI family DNA-binding transcriptional regulator [Streptomyces sp. NPDC003717]|uniref:LacI family DNA-binding transcriptional regulator n=1 Tax=Streptomyces sp. NPDC003717 TaxID=3154276 RepID=UPI0033BD6712